MVWCAAPPPASTSPTPAASSSATSPCASTTPSRRWASENIRGRFSKTPPPMKLLTGIICWAGLATVVNAAGFRQCLLLMNEPDLAGLTKDTNLITLRVTILPTFGNPITVRIQQEDKTFKIWAKRLDGAGGYDPGKLAKEVQLTLSTEESEPIFRSLNKLNPFEIRSNEEDHEQGLDGSEWTIECVRSGAYHVIKRWSPEFETNKRGLTNLVDFCEVIVRKAGF